MKRRDIEKAIRALRKAQAPINISTVAAKAGVVRKTIYKHRDLVAVIDQYRHTPNDNEVPTTTGRDSTIITALRRRLATQDDEIKQLRATVAEQKTTIELLYGQLDSYT